ncbi:hypothetical protein LTR24_009873 [Lithohypha guttulata]|uniref:Uncharacterized protein n=1 Tax=Lithohypha guttulata TaxID=1690604 RepID=A0ABR0JVQ6_9EURO|nr:hypothetical protein LTR24_009873 [Lithohypha guttulata]
MAGENISYYSEVRTAAPLSSKLPPKNSLAMSTEDLSKLQAGNLFSVSGLNVVITGGGSGLGSFMARALAVNRAAKVFIIGRREEALNRTKSSLPEKYSKNIVTITADVTSKSSLASALDNVKNNGVNELDVLICNSGISGPKVDTNNISTIDELSQNMLAPAEQDVTSTYHVNLTGIHLTVATFLPLLDAANKARSAPSADKPFKPRPQIITTSSIGGVNRRPMGNISYGPSKAGVIHMTKQLATVLVPYDIRANTIAPGLYLSEMTQDSMQAQGKAETHNIEGTWGKDIIPATRSGDEEDMAGVVLWLCSRAGGYTNGCVVVTDGGRMGVVPGSY